MKRTLLTYLLISLLTLPFAGGVQAQNKELALNKWDGGEQKYELLLSPNPFEDILNIKVTPGGKKLTGIRIVDIIGKEVAWIDLSGGVYSYTLDCTNLKPGVYFCSVYTEKGILETKKLFRTK
ncbi:MAG: T9SS type A sorting domain-containing protein [Cytophagaceae bacterium]